MDAWVLGQGTGKGEVVLREEEGGWEQREPEAAVGKGVAWETWAHENRFYS